MKKHLTWLLSFCLLAGQLPASTFVVGNTADSGPGSLRQAILDANATSGGNVIELPINGTITLASALPTITNNTTIIGPGTNLLTISGNDQVRVFSMAAGTTNVLSGITVADGWVTSAGMLNHYTNAPGIANEGSLRLTNCLIRNCTNVFQGAGGGIYNSGDLEMQGCMITECGNADYEVFVRGGGIYNSGVLQMTDCVILRCRAGQNGPSGGGIFNTDTGELFLTNSVIESCNSFGHPEGDGGGLANQGSATLDSCTISNCAGYWAGGILDFGVLTMVDTTVHNNNANMGGGILAWGSALFSGCTISDNKAFLLGAGIHTGGNLKMENCTLSQNILLATSGGDVGGAAIADKFSNFIGTNHLNHCTVISNSTVFSEVLAAGTFCATNCILADCKGTLISGGRNLLLNLADCAQTGDLTGNLYGVNPLLGPLQDNGGPTLTHAPLPGSPVIDQASASGLHTDQCDRLRPCDVVTIANAVDGSDIGAVEARPASVIEGRVTGFALRTEVGVNVGTASITTVAGGRYSLGGLDSGSYTVTPMDANYVFGPNNHTVNVSPDKLDANFRAFRWNSLSIESISNKVFHLVVAGTNGQTHAVMAASTVNSWSNLATRIIGPSNYFDIFDPISGTGMRLYRTGRIQ